MTKSFWDMTPDDIPGAEDVGSIGLFRGPFPLANDQPIKPPKPAADSYYYREIWPRVVNEAFDYGWRMFVGIESKADIDGYPVTVVNRGRELTRSEALAFRGTTITVVSEGDGIISEENQERGDTWQINLF